MALETSGFQVPASIRAPEIPSNIGKVDVKGIYDSVTNALRSYEAIRTAPAMQNAVDAELALKTTRDTIEKGLVAPEAAARAANANLLKSKSEAGMGLVAPQTEAERQKALLTTAEAGVGLGTVGQRAKSDRLKREAEDVANILRSDPVLAKRMLENKSLTSTVRTINELQAMLADPNRTEAEKAAIRIQLKLQQTADQKAADDLAKSGVGLMELSDGRVVRYAKTDTGVEILGAPQTRIGSFSSLATPAATSTASPSAESLRFGNAAISAPVPGMTAPAAAPAAAAPAAPAAAPAAAGPAINPFAGVTPEQKAEATARVAKQKTLPKVRQTVRALEDKTELVDDAINQALALADTTTTGIIGSFWQSVPGTDAYKLRSILNTIGTNVGFDALTEMRQNSPTGGALGNVSDTENRLLQGTIAALDQGLDAQSLRANLEAVRRARNGALRRVREAFDKDFGDTYAGSADSNSLEERLKRYQ
jgi:hypothetical protein